MTEEDRDVACQLCGQGSELKNVAGQLHLETLDSGKRIAAHHRCMQFSSGLTQFKSKEFGGFEAEAVDQEINRGCRLSCDICRKTRGRSVRGATCGCALKVCSKSFHYPCAFNHARTITKRLVITKSKQNPDDKFVMYRVFCCREHERKFRKRLRLELRGKPMDKKGGQENEEENCDSMEEEASSQEDGQSAGEGESNSDEGGASPITNGSLDMSGEMLDGSSTLTDSPAVLSACATHNSDEEGGLDSTESSDTSVTGNTTGTVDISALSSPTVPSSGQPGKQTPARSPSETPARSGSPGQTKSPAKSRSPGQTPARSPGTKADISQPLLCHLTEELNTIHQNNGDEDVRNELTKDREDDQDDVRPVQNGWHPNGDLCDLSNSPGEESVENKSPDAPAHALANVVSQRERHMLKQCLVSVEKMSVLQAHTDNTAKPQPGVGVQKGSVLQPHSDNSQPADGQKKVAPSSPVKSKKAVLPSAATGQSSSGKKSGKLSTVDRSAKDSNAPNRTPSQDRTVQHTKSGGKVCDEDESPKTSQAGEVPDKDCVSCSSNNDARTKVADVSESRTVSDDSTVVPEVRVDLSMDTGSSAVQNQGCRKRRRRKSDRGQTLGEPAPKVSKEDAPTVCDLPLTDGVLLIPSHMEQFDAQEEVVRQAVADQFGVRGVWVWQRMTSRLQGALPSPIMLLFMLDLIRELQKDNNTGVLDLLFDMDTLTTKVNSYLIAQEHVFHRVGQDGIRQELESTLWSSMEQSVKSLPMLHLMRGQAGLVTLALSVPRFALSQHLTAHIQAYCGLFRWTQDTKVQSFTLTQRLLDKAAQREAMALKFWLTGVNPISEVTVLPSDDLFYDKSVTNAEFFQLAVYLREKTLTTPMVVGDGGEPVQQVVPLLVFQPVDVFLVSFPNYFQQACDKFFRDRGLVSGLALMPLCNLFTRDCRTVTGLLCSEEGRYKVTVYSAFCPATHPTTMALLEITHRQTDDTAQVAESRPESRPALPNTPVVVKRKRGRPRKIKS